MESITDSSPYICITSDTHAGAAIDTYAEYLDPSYRADFTAWRGAYKNPSKKLLGSKKTKNCGSGPPYADSRRLPSRQSVPRRRAAGLPRLGSPLSRTGHARCRLLPLQLAA